MNIRFAPLAKSDILEIGDWIAADNPIRAETFIDELIERCHSLLLHPLRFPEAGGWKGRKVRKLSHGGYLIFYMVDEEEIQILRIVHGSRDWASLFEAP